MRFENRISYARMIYIFRFLLHKKQMTENLFWKLKENQAHKIKMCQIIQDSSDHESLFNVRYESVPTFRQCLENTVKVFLKIMGAFVEVLPE